MEDKAGTAPPMQEVPTQAPPPYAPADPPPAYTGGPYAPGGEGYQGPPTVVMGAPTMQGVPGYPGQPTMMMGAPTMQTAPGITGYPSQHTMVMGAPAMQGAPVVTLMKVGQFGPFPMQVSCPQCQANVMTETNATPGALTWLLSGALLCFGCWYGCCLIPCCISECQDIEHRCPNCKAHLGAFRRI